MPNQPLWDPDFIEVSLDEIKDMLSDAMKSRRKVFEETYTMTTMGRRVETITVTVRKVR